MKNLVGWLLILGAPAAGLTLPGPFGIPLFLVGFALITFPGKRRLTARFLSGRPVSAASPRFRQASALAAVILPGAVLAIVRFPLPQHLASYKGLIFGAGYFAAGVVLWFLARASVSVVNRLLALMPRFRRRVRPWTRRHGITLLPRRRRRRRTEPGGPVTRAPDEEIIEIAERHQKMARGVGSYFGLWLRRFGGAAVTIAIFVWMFRPVVRHWSEVKDRVWETSPQRVLLASAMFALFLFLFRSLAWRRILTGFGHNLPVAASTRIWSTSELARYLPGVIWQVVGRVYLVKPYGVRGSVCSTSQILELAIFLLANVLVAITCLLWFGVKHLHGAPRHWLFVSMALVPVLFVLLHPRVFYVATNRVLARLGKPPVEARLTFGHLAALLVWTLLGLLWQSLAIWVATAGPLGLQLTKWWVVAGAYCLAWCAGFLAFWAPGGIGVRELVFATALEVALPDPVRAHFANPKALLGFLVFLSVLLRLWATMGELIVAGMAYALDYRGAMGRADAVGRVC